MAMGTTVATLDTGPHTIVEDTQLIQQFLAGDEAAFTRLVGKYRRLVYAVAFRFCHNHAEADDLTQETFVRAYTNLAKFRGESSFKSWLLRITSNLSINLTKSARISKDSGEAPEHTYMSEEAVGANSLIKDEHRQALYKAIQKLPPKQKETLVLKTFQEMTCEQVARVMRCSPGTVKANTFNALKRLRTILDPGGTS